MSDNRYSLVICSKHLGLSASSVKHRACMLGINTEHGITAKELKRIKEYKVRPGRREKGTLEELEREMEALK